MTREFESPQEHIGRVLESIVRALVDCPESVTIESVYVAEEGMTVFRIATRDQDDVRRLIGRQGRMARSIRTIISACSMKYKLRFTISIEERVSR